MKAGSGWGSKRNSISALKSVVDLEQDFSKDEALPIDPRFAKRFTEDEVYDPFDFSFARHQLNRIKNTQRTNTIDPFSSKEPQGAAKAVSDPFTRCNIDPTNLWAYNFILRYYVSEAGRIYHRDANVSVSAKNHKKLTKAIKRARAAGLISNVNNINFENPAGYYPQMSRETNFVLE